MNNITNDKVLYLSPRWREFYGFSLLFDNPGHNYSHIIDPTGKQKLLKIDCEIDPDALTFYQKIAQFIKDLIPSLPFEDYLFCQLPPSTYHVTAWDGVNMGNIRNLKPDSQRKYDDMFKAFPFSLGNHQDLFAQIKQSDLLKRKSWDIKFQFKGLTNFGNKVLVAELEAAEETPKIRFKELEQHRKNLNHAFQEYHGYSNDFRDRFKPHVSLGYFANEQYGRLCEPEIDNWTEKLREKLKGNAQTITFQTISLYGFTDMATFFKS